MKELTLKREICDTVAIIIVIGLSIISFDAWPAKILIMLGFIMSAIEIYVTDKRKNIECYPTKAAKFFTVHMYAILLIACTALFVKSFSQKEYALILGLALCSDAAGLICGRIFGHRHPKFSERISPTKTWAGYIGSLVATLVFGFIGILALHIGFSVRYIVFIVLSSFVCSIGDLVASGTKRELGIKHSSEYLMDIPVLRQMEGAMRSRHGYLDCLDSVSCLIMFAALILN